MYDLRDINDIPAAPATNAHTPTRKLDIDLEPTPPTPQTFEQRLERVNHDAAVAESHGFKFKETVYEAGTAVIDIGVENAKKSRADFEKLPLLSAGIRNFNTLIAEEKRHHLVTEIPGLRIETMPFALGVSAVKNTAVLTRDAAMQLADYIDVPGRVMAWLYKNGALEAQELLQRQIRTASNTKVKIRGRARANGEGREVFAILSEKYPIVDAAPTVTAEILDVLGELPGARIDIQYNRDTLTTIFDVQFHSNIAAGDYACGELFRAGVRIMTNDAGNGSLVVQAFVIRNLCLNLIILDESMVEFDRVVHAGSVESRVQRLQKAVAQARDAIGTFAKAWNNAKRDIGEPKKLDTKVRKNAKTEVETKTWVEASPEERVLGLVRGEVTAGRLPPINEDDIRGIAKAYWKDEMTATPVITYQGFSNALSRYAHEGMDRWSGAALEKAAGYYAYQTPQLNYQYVQLAG